jgi:hypothetical protein
VRSSTVGERTTLDATTRKTYYRVKIADALGTMQDMASLGGYNWLATANGDASIDQPVAGFTVLLRRETDASPAAVSLSPYRTDSPLNSSGAAVDAYRRITVDMAVVTGSRPVDASTDWKPRFEGLTDGVSMPDDQSIKIVCRDKGAYLIDEWIPAASVTDLHGVQVDLIQSFFNGRQQTLEAVMNALLLYAPISGVPETVHVVGSASTFVVTSFPLKFESVMSALQRAAELAVADFRYAWDDTTSAYRPTLTYPDRTSPTSAATFGSSQIVGWQQFEIDRLEVRNVIAISYRPKNSTSRSSVTVTSNDLTSPTSDSITRFGRRVLTIQEADDSAIDTSTEATNMGRLICRDTCDPKAKGEIEILPDWRIELNDYLTFSPNKYFDIAQDLAVVGIRESFEQNRQRMFLTLRGLPSAGYQRWRTRARMIDNDLPVTASQNGLSDLKHTDDDFTGTRTFTWTRGPNVAFIAFYEGLALAPISPSAFPSAGDVVGMATAGTSGASLLSSTTDSWVATRPPRGKQRFAIAVPYYKLGGRTVQGEALKITLDPLPSNLGAVMAELNDPLADGFANIALGVFGSASDWPVTVELWEGAESGSAEFTYTVNAVTADADFGINHLKALTIPADKRRTWAIKATNVAGEIFRATFTESSAMNGAAAALELGIGNNQSTTDLTAKAFAIVSAPRTATSMKWLASTSSQPSAASVIAGGAVVSSGAPVFSVADLGLTVSLGDTVYFTAVYYDAAGSRTGVQGKKVRENVNASKTVRISAAGLFSPYDPSTQTADITNGYYHTANGLQGNIAFLPIPKDATLTAVRARTYATARSLGNSYWAGFLQRLDDSGTQTQLGSEFDSVTVAAWETIALTSLSESTSGARSYQLVMTTVPGGGTGTNDFRIVWIEYDVTLPNLFVG